MGHVLSGMERNFEWRKQMSSKKYENGQLMPRINNDFRYHTPKDDQQYRYMELREKAKELAVLIAELTPTSREQSTAFTYLETAVMWANAAIARNE